MKKYDDSKTNEKIKEFLEEVIEIYKKHGLSLSHADGPFMVTEYHEAQSRWLREAYYIPHDWIYILMTDEEKEEFKKCH